MPLVPPSIPHPGSRLSGSPLLPILQRFLASTPHPVLAVEWAARGEALLPRALLRHVQLRPVHLFPPDALPPLVHPRTQEDLAELLKAPPSLLEEALEAARDPRKLSHLPPEVVSLALFLTHPHTRALLAPSLEGTPPLSLPSSASIHLHLLPSLLRWPQWALTVLETGVQDLFPDPHPRILVLRHQHDYWLTSRPLFLPWLSAKPLSLPEASKLLSSHAADPSYPPLPPRFRLRVGNGVFLVPPATTHPGL